jgi:hypothetical protein
MATALSRQCESCGAPLAVHQRVRGGYCDRGSCRIRHFSGVQRQRREARQHKLEAIRSALADRGLPPSTPMATLPTNDARLAPLPEGRRRTFRDHLNRLISEAAAARFTRDAEVPDSPHPTFPDLHASQAELAVLGNGCGVCLGKCCLGGGTHAYLDARSVHRFMEDRPELRPREILERYLETLPARTYEGSCVFHTTGGCALPREMRGNTCNTFFCDDLFRLRDTLRSSGSKRVLSAAFHGTELRRVALIDERGTAPLSPAETDHCSKP